MIYWPYWADSRACPRPAWPSLPWPVPARSGLVSFTADLVMDFFGFLLLLCFPACCFSLNSELDRANFKVKSDVKEN